MRKIKSYFKGVAFEARRIRWPKKRQLWTSVLTVCIIGLLTGLVIYFEDWITANILHGFEQINPSESSTSSDSSSASASAVQAAIALFKNSIK